MKRSVKVVKKPKRPSVQLPAKVDIVGSRDRLSQGIKSWVTEFRQRDETKSFPPFDSLFKKELPNTDNVD